MRRGGETRGRGLRTWSSLWSDLKECRPSGRRGCVRPAPGMQVLREGGVRALALCSQRAALALHFRPWAACLRPWCVPWNSSRCPRPRCAGCRSGTQQQRCSMLWRHSPRVSVCVSSVPAGSRLSCAWINCPSCDPSTPCGDELHDAALALLCLPCSDHSLLLRGCPPPWLALTGSRSGHGRAAQDGAAPAPRPQGQERLLEATHVGAQGVLWGRGVRGAAASRSCVCHCLLRVTFQLAVLMLWFSLLALPH
mgnify:CR=1 FL=1